MGGDGIGPATVLVVEDELINRASLARGVEHQGHHVLQAADGDQALATLADSAVDMVLLDLVMPGTDGFTVLQRMAEDGRMREIPVLVISAVDTSEDVARALEMGAIDCLAKPVDPVLLRVRMRTALEQARLRELERDYLRQELAMRQQERLATLGRLSAGLGHELNNPAAAALSTARHLRDDLTAADDLLARILERADGAAVLAGADQLRTAVRNDTTATGDATRLADDTDHLETLLGRWSVPAPWNLASELSAVGVGPADVEAVGTTLGDAASLAVEWMLARERIRRQVDRITDSVGRVADLTSALRGYTYLDRAPQQDVDVRRGLDDTVTILGHKRPDGVDVVRDYADDVPRIQAFGGQLNQVWTNLIDNAIDAVGDRGTIRLRAVRDGDGVVVEVADDGPGIPAELRARIFDPFVTTKPPGQGTGLGLSIAYGIVTDVHGGSLDVSSDAGATTFRVRLPAAPPGGDDDGS